MITLSNGDRWILGDFEWKDLGISYEEACEGLIPATTLESFVKTVCSGPVMPVPEKWTLMDDQGYWDSNFDVYKEVFSDIATRILSNPWSDVYEMPWGEVIVVAQRPDSGGYDCQYLVETYKDQWDYYKEVVFDAKKKGTLGALGAS